MMIVIHHYHCERFEPRNHFKSRLSLIIRVNVVLNRTVVVDSDWRFDNLCGSQSEVYHVSWWYYTLVIDLTGSNPIQSNHYCRHLYHIDHHHHHHHNHHHHCHRHHMAGTNWFVGPIQSWTEIQNKIALKETWPTLWPKYTTIQFFAWWGHDEEFSLFACGWARVQGCF